MRKILSAFICILLFSSTLQSQVLLYEDFGPSPLGYVPGTWPFPAGFLKRNVDSLPPNAAVDWVNEAWEVREDFGGAVADAVAFSTSWYNPVGISNDWVWTPMVGPITANTILSWNAKVYDPSYPDGYEVRIMRHSTTPGGPTGGGGVIGNQITNSNILFSIPAENNFWTARSFNLGAYGGDSIWVGFRNISNDMYLLVIDDIKVETISTYDAMVNTVNTISEYTQTPKTQVSPLPLIGNINNLGISGLTNVGMKVDVYNSSNTLIYTSTSPLQPSLASSANANFNAGTWTPPAIADIYTLKFYPVMSETDEQLTNDTMIRTVEISDFTYARDSGTVVGQLGIGAGNGGFMGQEFQIYSAARLTSVQTYVTQGWTGRPYAAVVWNMAGGFPNAIVAYTDTLFYPDDSADFYTIPMDGGEFVIAPGSYAVTMVEFPGDSILSIGLTNNIFTTNRTWVDWPTNPVSPWGNNEDYGSLFQKSYVIRPMIYPFCPPDILTGSSTTPAGCGLNTGTATAITTGSGPFSYSWSSGGTAMTETGLGIGSYTVTVTDMFSGCSETATVTIVNSAAPTIDSLVFTDPLCFNQNNGTATVFVSGGTPGYTYLWSNGETTMTAIQFDWGFHQVFVTDTAGCQVTSSFVLNNPTVVGASVIGNDESCVGCNDGSATVTPSGGTPGYTYNWAPSGGTAATATGLTPGTYTVTVTDANGCSTTSTTTINAFVPNAIEDNIGLYATQVFPNPSNGTFTLTGTIDYTGSVKIELMSVLGSIVMSKTTMIDHEINTTIDVQVKPGSYILKITAGTQTNSKQLIIK